MSSGPAGSATRTASTVTTWLSAAFNLLVLLVLSFGLMPQVNRSIRQSEQGLVTSQLNQTLMAETAEMLKEQNRTIRRLGTLLDAMEAKAKEAAKAAKEIEKGKQSMKK